MIAESSGRRLAHDPTSLLLTAERLARLLDVSKRTLWRLRSAGKLPRPVQLGGSLRWRADEVSAWVAAGCPDLRDWEAQAGRKP